MRGSVTKAEPTLQPRGSVTKAEPVLQPRRSAGGKHALVRDLLSLSAPAFVNTVQYMWRGSGAFVSFKPLSSS